MFGMGFFEIVVIVIVAVIFLGPDKLPQAIVDVVKFFKVVKKTIHDAKQTIDSELNLSSLQQEAISYHQHFTSQVDTITKDIQLQEIDEIFSEYKALPPSKDSAKEATLDSSPSLPQEPATAKKPAKSKSQSKRSSSLESSKSSTPKKAKTPSKSASNPARKAGAKKPAKSPKSKAS